MKGVIWCSGGEYSPTRNASDPTPSEANFENGSKAMMPLSQTGPSFQTPSYCILALALSFSDGNNMKDLWCVKYSKHNLLSSSFWSLFRDNKSSWLRSYREGERVREISRGRKPFRARLPRSHGPSKRWCSFLPSFLLQCILSAKLLFSRQSGLPISPDGFSLSLSLCVCVCVRVCLSVRRKHFLFLARLKLALSFLLHPTRCGSFLFRTKPSWSGILKCESRGALYSMEQSDISYDL